MKVQFIFPNIGCPIGFSIGVAILSAELKTAGHDTSCIHINDYLGYSFDLERIRKDVEEYGPDLIAFSFGTNHLIEVKSIASHLKKYFQTPIIFGGIHTTLNTEDIISLDYVDMACVGEGDGVLVKLIDKMEKGEDYTSIHNLWVKKDGKIYKNKIRPLTDLTDVAIMDTEIFDFQKIIDLRNGWANVVSGRGCPFMCSYCHNNGVVKLYKNDLNTTYKDLNYTRRRGVDNMISELKMLKEKYSIKAFSFNDDVFTINKPWVMEFLKRYKDEIGLPFVCNTSAAFMDDDIAGALAEAHCDLVRFGVESGSESVRKEILGRKMPDSVVFKALKAVRKTNTRTFTYNMMAIPSEKEEDMLSTLRLNAKLMPDGLRVSLAYPYPGTDLYDICDKMDLLDDVEYHDYLTMTKLKYSDEKKLFIDKTRVVYWWHINKYLDNSISKIYENLLKMVDEIPADEWYDEKTLDVLLALDESISQFLSKINKTHYTAKFKHRPDIAILVRGDNFMTEDLLDPH